MSMSFKEEERFNKVLRVRKVRLKTLGKCMVGHALWHNRAEIMK